MLHREDEREKVMKTGRARKAVGPGSPGRSQAVFGHGAKSTPGNEESATGRKEPRPESGLVPATCAPLVHRRQAERARVRGQPAATAEAGQ